MRNILDNGQDTCYGGAGLDTIRHRMKMFNLPFRGIETHQLVEYGVIFYIRRAHSHGAVVDLWVVWWCYVKGWLLL